MKRFRLGAWQVHPDRNLLVCGERARTIEPRHMDVLVLLARAGGAVVSKEELLHEVWQDRFVVEHVVPKTVSALRRALGETARSPHIIETVPRRGYRLACPVSQAERGTRSASGMPPATSSRTGSSRWPRWTAAAALGALALLLWTGGPIDHTAESLPERLLLKYRFRFAAGVETSAGEVQAGAAGAGAETAFPPSASDPPSLELEYDLSR